MKITCDVIKDLAELYVDNALSDDSKKIVEEHIENCTKCKEYIEKSRKALEEPLVTSIEKVAEEKAKMETLRDKILGKLLPFIMMMIVALTIVFVSINYVLFEHEIIIPYDGKSVYVTEEGILHYPNCYDVAFIQMGASEYLRVQVHTHYIDKIRGHETKEEALVDLKELVEEEQKTILYRSGIEEQVIWENK